MIDRRLEPDLGECPAQVAFPFAVIFRQQTVGGAETAVGDLFEFAKENGLVIAGGIELLAPLEPVARKGDS